MRAVADFDVNDFKDHIAQDDRAYVRFYMRPIQKVNAEGVSTWTEKLYYEVMVPGSRDRIDQPVTEITLKQYPLQYAKYKATNSTEGVTGTFLTEVSWLARGQVEELAYWGVKTLEQLAEAPDTLCQKMTGTYALREKAKTFIEKRDRDAPILAIHARFDALKAEAEVKDQTIAALTKRLDALEAADAAKHKGK